MTLSRLTIDTGAECTLISPEDSDEIVTTYVIGGPLYSIRKMVDSIQFDDLFCQCLT